MRQTAPLQGRLHMSNNSAIFDPFAKKTEQIQTMTGYPGVPKRWVLMSTDTANLRPPFVVVNNHASTNLGSFTRIWETACTGPEAAAPGEYSGLYTLGLSPRDCLSTAQELSGIVALTSGEARHRNYEALRKHGENASGELLLVVAAFSDADADELDRVLHSPDDVSKIFFDH